MRERVKDLSKVPLVFLPNTSYFVVLSKDDDAYYQRSFPAKDYPFQILEIHASNEVKVLATVFSYRTGKRFVIAFDRSDVRPL